MLPYKIQDSPMIFVGKFPTRRGGPWCWESSSRNVWWCFVVMVMVRGVGKYALSKFAWLKLIRCHHVARKLLDFGMSIPVQYFWTVLNMIWLVFPKVDALPTATTGNLNSHHGSIWCELDIQLLSCCAKHAFNQPAQWLISFSVFATCARKSDFILPHLWEPILMQFGFHCHKELQIDRGWWREKEVLHTDMNPPTGSGRSSIRPVLHGLAISQSKFKRWNWPHRSSRVLTIK